MGLIINYDLFQKDKEIWWHIHYWFVLEFQTAKTDNTMLSLTIMRYVFCLILLFIHNSSFDKKRLSGYE